MNHNNHIGTDIRWHIFICMLSGLIVGWIETSWFAILAGKVTFLSIVAFWVGSILLAGLGGFVGLISWFSMKILQLDDPLSSNSMTSIPSSDHRHPSFVLDSLLLKGIVPLILGLGFGLTIYKLLPGLLALHDNQLVIDLIFYIIVLCFLGYGLILIPVLGLFNCLYRYLALRFIKTRLLLVFGFLGLSFSLIIVLSHFISSHHSNLGFYCVVPYACLILLLSGSLWCCGASIWSEISSKKAVICLMSYFSISLIISAFSMSASVQVRTEVNATIGPRILAEQMRHITDFDNDGQSSLFGGSDCAPFDSRRSPVLKEVPNNGIDENCDGKDAEENQPKELAHAQPKISPHLVKKYNIILIIIDALRADRLGLRTDQRDLTKEIDRLAKESLVFSRAFSQAPSTRLTFPNVLTGLDSGSLGWKRINGRLQMQSDRLRLTQHLKNAGYSTGLVVNGWIKKNMRGILPGFDVVRSVWLTSDYKYWRRGSSPGTTAMALDFINKVKSNSSKPFFLTLYYEDPHAPYEDLTDRGMPPLGKLPVDRYNAEIAYADRNVGFLLDYLKYDPYLWQKTVVIIFGDHGEEFGEHGGKFHDRTCYWESTRVSLVVRIPGIEAKVVNHPVALIDIAPTLLQLSGIKTEQPLDGFSLLNTAADDVSDDRPINCTYFSDKNPRQTLVRALRMDNLTYIENYNGNIYELYDTDKDPREKKNLAKQPQYIRVCGKMSKIISRNVPEFIE